MKRMLQFLSVLCDALIVSLSREKGGGRRGECADTMQWASVEEGGGRREEKVVRGWRAWARPRGNSAVRPFE